MTENMQRGSKLKIDSTGGNSSVAPWTRPALQRQGPCSYHRSLNGACAAAAGSSVLWLLSPCVCQDGLVSLQDLQAVLLEASKEFSHLEEHARFLEAKNNRWAGSKPILGWHSL